MFTVEPVFSLHKTFTLDILEGLNFRDSFEVLIKFYCTLNIIAPRGKQMAEQCRIASCICVRIIPFTVPYL